MFKGGLTMGTFGACNIGSDTCGDGTGLSLAFVGPFADDRIDVVGFLP